MDIKIIKPPCNTGDMIWFINEFDNVSWGYVVGFTESHIIVWSASTEHSNYKEFLPLSEWDISIVKTKERKDAENIIFNNTKIESNYYNNHGFLYQRLGK